MPREGDVTAARLYMDSAAKRSIIGQPSGNLGSEPLAIADAQQWYRGALPMVSGSFTRLDLLLSTRQAGGATQPTVYATSFAALPPLLFGVAWRSSPARRSAQRFATAARFWPGVPGACEGRCQAKPVTERDRFLMSRR
jgi:hypothetical protein